MKEKKEKTMKPFPGGNIRNWELVAREITLSPQGKKQLRIALKERTKIRRRKEEQRRQRLYK